MGHERPMACHNHLCSPAVNTRRSWSLGHAWACWAFFLAQTLPDSLSAAPAGSTTHTRGAAVSEPHEPGGVNTSPADELYRHQHLGRCSVPKQSNAKKTSMRPKTFAVNMDCRCVPAGQSLVKSCVFCTAGLMVQCIMRRSLGRHGGGVFYVDQWLVDSGPCMSCHLQPRCPDASQLSYAGRRVLSASMWPGDAD